MGFLATLEGHTPCARAVNGGASTTIIYDGSETGRDVTIAASKGFSWERLSGTTDGSGMLTIIATAPTGPAGTVHWQTYMNGVQVDVMRPGRR